MAISQGPKLGLINNADIQEQYYDQFRQFLQAVDQLIMGNIINSTTVVPPVSPSNGDAYLLISGTPSGAWTGQGGKIAVWDTQVTNSGTNTRVPAWVFYTPNPGWTLWNVATSSFIIYNGSTWTIVSGGANFPTNTDITSMTGIPNTTIDTTGYVYNDGTKPPTYVGDAASGFNSGGNVGLAWGTGSWGAPTADGAVVVGDGTWSGSPYSGVALTVSSTAGDTVIGAGSIYTANLNATAFQNIGTSQLWGTVAIGSGTAGSHASILARGTNDAGIALNPVNVSTLQVGIYLNANGGGAAHVGLVGFGGSYPTQTTVGAAGGASALPVTPAGYLPIVIGTTEYVLPYYLPV